MGLKALKIASGVLAIAGAILNVVSGQIGEKLQDAKLDEKIADALNK